MLEKIQFNENPHGRIVGLSPLGHLMPVVIALVVFFAADYIDQTEGVSPSSIVLGVLSGVFFFATLNAQIGRRVE